MLLTFKVLPAMDRRARCVLIVAPLLAMVLGVTASIAGNVDTIHKNNGSTLTDTIAAAEQQANDAEEEALTAYFREISSFTMLLLNVLGVAAAVGFYTEVMKSRRGGTAAEHEDDDDDEDLKDVAFPSSPSYNANSAARTSHASRFSPPTSRRSRRIAKKEHANHRHQMRRQRGGWDENHNVHIVKGPQDLQLPQTVCPAGGKATDPAHTVMALVLDRSGSMAAMGNEVKGGTNAYLDEQRAADRADGARTSIVLTTFDSTVEIVHDNVELTEVAGVTDEQVLPRGATALHDAIGATLIKTADIVNGLDTQPSVQIFILTDGHENASSMWSHQDVNDAILKLKLPENGGWDFYFAAANQDAMAVGSTLGMDADQCMTFSGGSGEKMASAMKSTHGAYMRSKKSAGRVKGFTPYERASAM